MSTPAPAQPPASIRAAAGRVLRRNRRRHAYASVCIMGHQSCEALVPLLLGVAIDTAVGHQDPARLVLVLAAMVLLFTALTLCWRWAARFGYGASIDEAHRTRSELASGFLREAGRSKLTRGEQLSLATSDADLSAQTVTYSSSLFGAAAALAVSCAILITINPLLGLGLIAVAITTALCLGALSPLVTRRTTRQQESLAAASAWATDALGGLRVLHGLGAQSRASGRYRLLSAAAVRSGIRAGNAQGLQFGATSLAGTVVMGAAVIFAGSLALDGSISIGAFVAAVGTAQFMTEPLSHIGFFLQMRAATHAGLGRILAAAPKPPAPDTAAAPACGGAVRGLQLRLAQPEGTQELHVAEGDFIGVLADALSLAALRAALDPDLGSAPGAPVSAVLHGLPLESLAPGQRRKVLHFEPHHVDLFGGSVGDNVVLGGTDDPPAARDISVALQAAHARDFVEAMVGGSAARVMERGVSLSGGQRQRLALARALHAAPALLVLDHPTSAVDSATESAIAHGLRATRHGGAAAGTTMVLTTSPALLSVTDRVLFVRSGKPALVGTHALLLATHESYRSEFQA